MINDTLPWLLGNPSSFWVFCLFVCFRTQFRLCVHKCALICNWLFTLGCCLLYGHTMAVQALVGHHYGAASLPTRVEVSEYQLLLNEGQKAGISTQEVERMYQRDENSIPTSYCRTTLSRHTSGFQVHHFWLFIAIVNNSEWVFLHHIWNAVVKSRTSFTSNVSFMVFPFLLSQVKVLDSEYFFILYSWRAKRRSRWRPKKMSWQRSSRLLRVCVSTKASWQQREQCAISDQVRYDCVGTFWLIEEELGWCVVAFV